MDTFNGKITERPLLIQLGRLLLVGTGCWNPQFAPVINSLVRHAEPNLAKTVGHNRRLFIRLLADDGDSQLGIATKGLLCERSPLSGLLSLVCLPTKPRLARKEVVAPIAKTATSNGEVDPLPDLQLNQDLRLDERRRKAELL